MTKKRTRRNWSMEQKRRILAEVEEAPYGSQKIILARYNITTAYLVQWRKQIAAEDHPEVPA